MTKILGMVACLSVTLAAQDQTKLPDGEGRELVERVCSKCHGLDATTSSRMSPAGWSDTVDEMVSRGAKATDKEIDIIVRYLAANFNELPAKINVNRAAEKALAEALRISAEDAGAIVRYREKNGNFKAWEDLKKVPGIDLKKIESRQDRIEY